ncbi:mitochondrial ribosomal protein subunit-domain-containing protein [Gloeopeniophorella convolvens]|nr:mitochondrial ribosomal protein subunit-domain-containing protein [Gloeopeniophorella convolvens]
MAAIAKVATVIPPTPSPFATLLRRSKFASYDPTIGQVYTAYDGDAHRGNFGLKRPLAIRKRNKFISVEAIDSPEQQTEWTSRESEARFIRRWAEVNPEPHVRGPWEKHYMGSRPVHAGELPYEDASGKLVDLTQQRAAEEDKGNRNYVASVPQVASMSPKQFARYLEKLRQQRPEFLKHLAQSAERSIKSKSSSVLQVAPTAYDEIALSSADKVRLRYLQKQAHAFYEAEGSKAIEQRPHRNGGLAYAHTSMLTHFFTANEQPGRFVESQDQEGREVVRVSFAGMAANLRTPINHHEPTSKFRVVNATLKDAPKVVSARPQGLKGALVETTLEDVVNLDMMRANPFLPGTRAYITQMQRTIPVKGKRSMTAAFKPQDKVAESTKASGELLSTLKGLMNGMDKRQG